MVDVHTEFDRQVTTLIDKGYAKVAQVSEDIFKTELESLRKQLPKNSVVEIDVENGTLPFVIVVKSSLVSSEQAMSLVDKNGKQGIAKLFPHQATDFDTIAQVEIPASNVYLLIDIDRGKATINLPPVTALELIAQAKRSPLTIDEGIAIATHFPEYLMKNNCFSLLASRHSGDQRVPAIWINGQKQANLGWCWNGNPHTWLGSASCGLRIGGM